MNKKILFLIFMGLLSVTTIKAQMELEWVKGLGGASDDYGYSIAIDAVGNVYITGTFKNTVDFDPSVGVFNLNADSLDIFITKLDVFGNFVWAKQFGGVGPDYCNSIATDALGNVYTTGTFHNTVDFNPGAGVFNLTPVGADIFISKLDSTGNFVWAKQFGGANNDYGFAITTDASGNIYSTGKFGGTADFDPGAGTFNLTSLSGFNIYISKLDVSGNFIWAKQLEGPSDSYVNCITTDDLGNVYTTGRFDLSVDFDPGVGSYNLTSLGGFDIFINKLDSFGNFVWAKKIGGTGFDEGKSLTVDDYGNVYTTGSFSGSVDFDPNVGVVNINGNGSNDIFINKLDSSGNFVWAKQIGGIGISSNDYGYSITTDNVGNIYTTGSFYGTADFNSGAGVFNLTSISGNDAFISKLDNLGNFIWAKTLDPSYGRSIITDTVGNIYMTGIFSGSINVDPSVGGTNFTSAGSWDIFIAKLNQKGVFGFVYNDVNEDCLYNTNEIGILGRKGLIQPSNILIETNSIGRWYIDSLPIGNYTLTFDTSGKWQATCLPIQNFTVTNPNGITYVANCGLLSTEPCAEPNVAVIMPFVRRCFSNQRIYAQACNTKLATGVLNVGYVVLELDTLLTLTSSSLTNIYLGNNTYRFDVGTLNPGQCVNFWVNTTVSCNAVLGQTLCMKANLYPADSCVFDTILTPSNGGVEPCTLPWDKSSLSVNGWCQNDSIYFAITNTGDFGNGDMQCYVPVRIYIDGVYTILDSVLLVGGQTYTYIFVGDGRTWRLEADQHPLHPGNSHPNSTVELCGNATNWTPNLVNILPMDDADPVVDIYCGVVTGSYDPNDKTGYPLGVGINHIVAPNGKLDYLIRFQNTGTDTAFTVVVRDTLDVDLDIFSVRSGVSSHNYTFKMFGPRVMEWTFNNIMLPDSSTDQVGSNGFVTFTVLQNPDLADGTEINNHVGIYFDFNDPIITNTTSHIIGRDINTQVWSEQTTFSTVGCDEVIVNNFTYNQEGIYFQVISDTLLTIEVTLNRNEVSITEEGCLNYTLNGQTYTESGVYIQNLTNSFNCDSVVTLNLIINSVDTMVVLNGNDLSANLSNAVYQWINCDNGFSTISGEINQTYSPTVNGNYAVIVTDSNCTDTSSCVNVLLTSVNSINNENLIQFYPNPTGEILSLILNTSQELYIEIYSVDGKLMGSKIITKNTVFDVSQYPTGMYFITATNNEGKVYQSKFVKE